MKLDIEGLRKSVASSAERGWIGEDDEQSILSLIAQREALLEALKAALLVHGDTYSWADSAKAAIKLATEG